jgi:hypothetical protein
MKDLFWRLFLAVFGPLLEWWQRKQIKYYIWKRKWQCRRGHIDLRRTVFPVGERFGEAIIIRKFSCQWCGAIDHKTWKGRMTRAQRRVFARRRMPATIGLTVKP